MKEIVVYMRRHLFIIIFYTFDTFDHNTFMLYNLKIERKIDIIKILRNKTFILSSSSNTNNNNKYYR